MVVLGKQKRALIRLYPFIIARKSYRPFTLIFLKSGEYVASETDILLIKMANLNSE